MPTVGGQTGENPKREMLMGISQLSTMRLLKALEVTWDRRKPKRLIRKSSRRASNLKLKIHARGPIRYLRGILLC
jgi:hypothetical protein